MELRLIAWLAETPVHAGTGQTAGAVDLPIQRERHTGHPTIASSGLKGALRQAAREAGQPYTRWFGPETRDANQPNSAFAGCVALTDARLAAFPVRSLYEVFVWVTCPWTLSRLARDLGRIGGEEALVQRLSGAVCAPGAALKAAGSALPTELVLEDLTLQVTADPLVASVAGLLERLTPQGPAHQGFRQKLARHLLVLSDSDYGYLVRNACPVDARNVLDEKKTSINLWYEESLPPDSLLYSLVLVEGDRSPEKANSEAETSPGEDAPAQTEGAGAAKNGKKPTAAEIAAEFGDWIGGEKYLQVGGNETIGQGWCCMRLLRAADLAAQSAEGGAA